MDMQNTTKIALAWELAQEEVPKVHVAERLGIGRATLYRWLGGIEEERDLEGFIDQYPAAKKGPRKKQKVDPLLKRRVWRLREEKRNCCGQKMQSFLERDYGTKLGIKQVYEILGERYQLRTRWKKNQKRGPVPNAEAPPEVIEMDTVDFGEIFAFSGVAIFTKEADVILRPSLTGHDGYLFLRTSMKRRLRGYAQIIQTDGGPEFKDESEAHGREYAERHRVSRPY
jgi:transposase